MSSDDEQVSQNIPMILSQHFQTLISDDVEKITMHLFALDAEDDVDSQEGKHEPEPSSYNEGAPAEFANYLQRFKSLRSKDTHIALRNNLMEHLWNLRQVNQE
ncbi:hypothetical protein E3N88_29458 [Mikania micrantha]|uniref:Uncharacterized protein n=1 Tax=Mikania micrantha TaxID=192012 RepID=A0A5N6MIW4_9ASTR|nr:hypothetical protein E3N88_29458 [Mikania micrantha]